MKKKTIIASGIVIVLLIAASASVGFIATKREINSAEDNTSTESPLLPVSVESEYSETSDDSAGDYKIILDGTRLMLYFKDELINEAGITPDVLPVADVKALTGGIEYKSEEDALVDWESLCN